jgi:hypothetical protein
VITLFLPYPFQSNYAGGTLVAKFRKPWAGVRLDTCKIIFELGASEGREEDPAGD